MKIAAFYYTQTGQTLEILRSITRPLVEAGHEVVYREIQPERAYPFPWTYDSFFEAFPESRLGVGCRVETGDLETVADAGLVLIAWQPWFLSPSIPLHGFFQDQRVRQFLKGRPVILINGCRNMWVMAQERMRTYLAEAGARWVGNIVLQDTYPNLVSVVTIVRWLIGGRKKKKGLWPAAGVSAGDIARASVFGEQISRSAASDNGFSGLQAQLLGAGAIRYKPSIVFIERVGHRMFGLWASWILKKGNGNTPGRTFRLRLFKYYLFSVLFILSPVGLLLLFYLPFPFRLPGILKDKRRQCRDLE
jgi:hypothetical protein